MLLLFLGIAFFRYAVQSVSDNDTATTVDIPSGTGFFKITAILSDAKLVHNRPFFWALAIGKGAARRIKAGEYEFSGRLSPSEIIDKLIRGEKKYYDVFLPEDLNARELAQRLLSFRLINEEEFMNLLSDRKFITSLGIKAEGLEGYLYPDTYRLDRSMTTREITRILVNNFWKKITPEIRKRTEEMGMTIHQLLTLASIIGKESGVSSEKPLISAVFHNRMKLGMKLQSDPTAIYGLPEDVKVVLSKHLKLDNPYNTYRIKGLPPGPIANPDIDSIRAALYPAKVNYLYFVAKNDGTHQFSTDLASHNRAILIYRNNK
ncbi:MAG: endolytic transglycosylase MltG [Syntrophobacterales bacterium]|nr:endolytic transglycosylase MltG [Syntrophobacterales bacterium]